MRQNLKSLRGLNALKLDRYEEEKKWIIDNIIMLINKYLMTDATKHHLSKK